MATVVFWGEGHNNAFFMTFDSGRWFIRQQGWLCEIVYPVMLVSILVYFVNFLPFFFFFFFFFFDIHEYYHNCVASEFLPDLIGEYKKFFYGIIAFNFFPIFYFLSLIRLEKL